MRRLVLIVLLAASTFALAETPHHWEEGMVLSQDLNSYQGGAFVAPLGTGIMGVPIMRRSNIVKIETSDYVLTWSEVGSWVHHGVLAKALVLNVNGPVQFYRDEDVFVVLDTHGKKHKFSLIGSIRK